MGDSDAGARRSEVGYALIRSVWGRGYATEAVGAVIRFGFEAMGLNRIEANKERSIQDCSFFFFCKK